MDFRNKKNKTEKPKFTIQLNRCNPSDFVIYEYLMAQKNVAGSIKLCLLYSGPGFLGHEKEVNIVFKEIAYGKGCTVLRCSGRRA